MFKQILFGGAVSGQGKVWNVFFFGRFTSLGSILFWIAWNNFPARARISIKLGAGSFARNQLKTPPSGIKYISFVWIEELESHIYRVTSRSWYLFCSSVSRLAPSSSDELTPASHLLARRREVMEVAVSYGRVSTLCQILYEFFIRLAPPPRPHVT